MYRIKLTNLAAENLMNIDKPARTQLLSTIEKLQKAPLLLGKSLKGPLQEYRSIRAAGQRYRIIHKVLEEEIIVIVIAVGIRKEGDKKDIYELMKKYIKINLLED